MLLIIIGFIASLTSTISLLPQIYRTYRTKSANDLSLLMLINFTICSISWVIYGALTHTVYVWLTNILMTVFSFIMLILKFRYHSGEVHGRANH